MEIQPILSTDKIILARIRREDIDEMTRLYSNLEMTTLISGSGMTCSRQDEEDYFERVSKNRSDTVTFGIYDKETQRYIGGVDLRNINHRHGTAELGISVANPDYWGGGYGSDAARLMVEYGLFFLGLHNIFLGVFAYNERAIKAYKKIGFKEIGRRRGVIRLGDRRYDAIHMDITADDVDFSAMRSLVPNL